MNRRKKNPPTVRAVGGLGICPVSRYAYKSASFKDSATWLMLCYRLQLKASATTPAAILLMLGETQTQTLTENLASLTLAS